MAHTIIIPDWLWVKSQRKFNKTNPATELRNILAEHSDTWLSSPITQPATRKWGSKFTAAFDSACHGCGKTIRAGNDAWKCDGGNMHADCYDTWVDTQGRTANG